MGSTAGLPSASARNHPGQKSHFHAWPATFGHYFKSMGLVTDPLQKPLCHHHNSQAGLATSIHIRSDSSSSTFNASQGLCRPFHTQLGTPHLESSSSPKAAQQLPSLQCPQVMAPGPAPLCPPYSLTSNLSLKLSFAILVRQTNAVPRPELCSGPHHHCLLLCTQVFEPEPAPCFVSTVPGDPKQIKPLSKYVSLPTAVSSATLRSLDLWVPDCQAPAQCLFSLPAGMEKHQQC